MGRSSLFLQGKIMLGSVGEKLSNYCTSDNLRSALVHSQITDLSHSFFAILNPSARWKATHKVLRQLSIVYKCRDMAKISIYKSGNFILYCLQKN